MRKMEKEKVFKLSERMRIGRRLSMGFENHQPFTAV